METVQNNQLAVIENSIEVLKTGPQILQSNQIRAQKALIVGKNILSAIQEEGITAELDERAKNYLININKALPEMKQERAAVTQIMDELKKMFTEVENQLDPKKSGTVPAQIQVARDTYAKQMAEEAERKRKEAEAAAAKAKQRIELISTIEIKLSNYFNDYLLSKKTKFQQSFNSLELKEFADNAAAIRQYTPCYNKKHFDAFDAGLYSSVFTLEELQALQTEVMAGKYETYNTKYVDEMTSLKKEIVDKLPSKFEELKEQKRLADEAAEAAEKARIAEQKRQEQIAKANAAEKERLEKEAAIARENERKQQEELKKQQDAAAAEQKRREEEEQKKLAAEAEEAKRLAEQEAEMKKQGEQTMVMFEQEAALADSVAPEARQGFEITVLHQAGYVQIFQLWFENEGKNLPIDKIGNTKLEQMKTWAEKQAHKTGTKIESKFLKYEDSYKAVNRKAK
jgi:hypothetical protein